MNKRSPESERRSSHRDGLSRELGGVARSSQEIEGLLQEHRERIPTPIQRYIDDLEDQNRRLEEENENLKEKSGKDPLTGVLNRQGYEAAILEKYPNEQYAVMTFIDLDGFKKMNDNYGYAVGDRVLVQAAHMIAAQMRPSDIVLRFGGDEFIVVWDIEGEHTDEERKEIIRRKEYELQVGLGMIGPDQEGASVGSAMLESPAPEGLAISQGSNADDEGGVLFQESRKVMCQDKARRKGDT